MALTATKEVEGGLVVAYSDEEKTDRCHDFGVVGRVFKSFGVHIYCLLVVLLDLVHPAKLDICVFMFVEG